MRIGVYTDTHASISSSILIGSAPGSKYSYRLDMIVKSYKWMYDIFDEKKVDLITNLGDIVSSVVLRSEEITAISEGLSYSKGIPEVHIVGNHERLDDHGNFYSSSFLNLCKNITVLTKPTKLPEYPDIAFCPYVSELTEDDVSKLSSKVLFSHIDIIGSMFNNTMSATEGMDPKILEKYFDLVVNGHIHVRGWVGDKILNLGHLVGESFKDNYKNGYPGIMILDTDTLKYEIIENPHSVRFTEISTESLLDLKKKLSGISTPVALKVVVPYEIKDEARQIVDQNSHVIASRVIGVVSENTKITNEQIETVVDIQSGKSYLTKFIDSLGEKLYYPKDQVLSLLSEMYEEVP